MKYPHKNTTLSLSIIAVLASSVAMTACSQQSSEQTTDTSTEKSDEHVGHNHEAHTEESSSKEHSHENHDEHKHDEHEHDHEESDGMVHHGKHVHGEADLTAVVEADKMVIELHSPSMNVFGFEHNPSTDEQKTIVEKQEALLKDSGKIITVDGGDCTATDVDVDMPFSEHAEHEEHTEHDHEHHDNEEHHEHENEQSKEHAEHQTHSDVKATYTYTCKEVNSITGFKTHAFSTFSGFTKINVNWVNGDKQGAKSLTKDDYNITFSE